MGLGYSQIIARRILSLCRQRGLSVNQLAAMSGVRQSTLNSLIHGKSKNPKMKTLHKIALAFSMTPAELLDFKELNEYSFDEEEEEDE